MQIDWKALVAISPSYRYSTVEKLRYLAAGFRQRCGPAAHLLAGPFAGEFGYELMQWQGFVRARRRHYAETHVITYPGREHLYEGCRVHYHETALEQAGFAYGRLTRTQALRIAHTRGAQIGLKAYAVRDPALLCTQYQNSPLGGQ